MRRSLLLATACAVSGLWLLAGAVPALADYGPHVEGQSPIADSCAGCHRAHTAKAPRLLKQEQSSLCYTCHGSTATGANNDVQDGLGYTEPSRGGTPGALRGGGFDYALIDAANPSEEGSFTSESVEIPVLGSGQATTSTHSIGGTAQMLWGNGEVSATTNYGREIDLSCGNCHNPHGNGSYRILQHTPPDAYENLGHGDTSHDVNIEDASTKVYTTTNYGKFGDENAPEFIEKISAWCSNCHTRYLAPTHSGRESSGDAVYTYRHTTEYLSHRPQCITCHVAHGSNASMGEKSASVTWPDGTSAGSDSRLLRLNNRGVCQACHHK